MKLDVDAPGGRRQAYAYTGGKRFDASLPAIVFLHGAMHDHSVWTLSARWFAHHGHAVLAPDLPGHSQSTGAPLESVEAIADWLLTLLDAAGVDEAALVGHSMGSLIALEAAARAPARVARLVMVGTAYPMAVSPALLEAGEHDPFAAIDSVNALSISTMAGKPSYPGPGVWLHGADRILARPIEALRLFGAALEQPGFDQRLELQRDGAEGHVRHRASDVSGRHLAIPDQAENLAPTGRGDGGQRCGLELHGL